MTSGEDGELHKIWAKALHHAPGGRQSDGGRTERPYLQNQDYVFWLWKSKQLRSLCKAKAACGKKRERVT